MAAPETTVFQFNFKDPAGNLHNVYATNGAEAVELLDVFESDILPKLFEVQSKITATSVVAVATAPAVTPTASPSAPRTSPGDAPTCEHGLSAKFVPAGISKKTGKPFRAFYTCPQPRGSECSFSANV